MADTELIEEPKIYTYEKALKSSEEYFNGDSLAAAVFVDKYSLRNEKDEILEDTPKKMHHRLAREFARIEQSKFKEPLTEEEIFDLFDKFKYIVCQGSPMMGIGNNNQIVSLSNCFVVSCPKDSYSSILLTDQELAQVYKRRGGAGLCLSNIRPKGTPINNAARNSTGITSFMERYSNTTREVAMQGRRGALMLTIDISHLDIEDFINIKKDLTKVTGANISIKISDEFMNAVLNDEDFTLKFPINSNKPTVTKTIKAKELWNKIISSSRAMAEPGILFWDNITKYNAVDCYEKDGFKSVSTNPCSEIPLCEYDSCRLMVLNLYSYVVNPFTDNSYFDFDLFSNHTKIAQRLMDNLVDLEIEKVDKILNKIEKDPESENVKIFEKSLWENIKKKAVQGRRTGLGITAEGDMLAALGIKYGSDESIKMVSSIHKTMKLSSFESSVDMANEIGPFQVWDWETEKNSEFLLKINEEKPELYSNIKKYGRRNIASLTCAPTGSVSILTQTTSGIEPVFKLSYTRRKKGNPSDTNFRTDFVDANGDCWQEFIIYHPKINKWKEITGKENIEESPWFGCTAEDLEWKQRVKLQAAIQVHVDHAISSTVNVPENITEAQIAEIYEEAWKSGCKGITVYRENCRTGVLITKKDKPDSLFEEIIFKNLKEATKDIKPSHTSEEEYDSTLRYVASEIAKEQEEEEKSLNKNAVKRPKELPCEVFHLTCRGEKFYVVVGLLNGQAYECFTGVNIHKGDTVIPNSIAEGILHKKARGQYILITKNGDSITLTNGHSDENADSLTRMVSTSLRHGIDVSIICHQLSKTTGDLFSFAKVLSRTLKKYAKDGSEIYGEECQCGNKLIRENGCKICKSCGFSKCD